MSDQDTSIKPLSKMLLEAVLANPEDDDPRGKFADWLREQGEDEWANFINLQLQDREPRICNCPELPWQGGSLTNNNNNLWVWHRGFVCRLSCTMDEWELRWKQITASCPVQVVNLLANLRSEWMNKELFAAWKNQWPKIKFVDPLRLPDSMGGHLLEGTELTRELWRRLMRPISS